MMMVRASQAGRYSATGSGAYQSHLCAAAYETVGKETKPNREKLELHLVPAKGLGTSTTEYVTPLRVLMTMVALVLVIACVNIIMLLAARNSIREREFALRLALGACRLPLFRQLLVEGALLVTAGALLGWLFTVDATHLLAAWAKLDVSLVPDRTVLVFTLAISAIAALLFGLAPLRAGLLLRTLLNYRSTDLGMRAGSVLAFGVHPLGSPSYEEKLAFYRQLSARLEGLPGVRSLTMAELRSGSRMVRQ